MDKKVSLARRG